MNLKSVRDELSRVGASKLPGLHALRGLAATSIVFFHLQAIPQLPIPTELYFIKHYLGMGVPLFFVISAFSLYLSSFDKIGKTYWLRSYFIKRVFRIAPLFYWMILVYLVFLYLRFGKTFSFSEIFINFTVLYNFFPGKHQSIVWAGWTIGVEALIYLLLPFCFIYVRNLGFALALLAVSFIVSIQARSLYAELDLPKTYAYMSLLSQFSIFAVGVPAYFLYRRVHEHTQKKPSGWHFWPAAA